MREREVISGPENGLLVTANLRLRATRTCMKSISGRAKTPRGSLTALRVGGGGGGI